MSFTTKESKYIGIAAIRDSGSSEEIIKALATLLRSAKRRTKEKGYQEPFTLTLEDLIDMYNMQQGMCFYTGLQMSINTLPSYLRHRVLRTNPFKLSLDRLDSRRGYVLDNIVLCCWCANQAKATMTYNNFLELCKLVVKQGKLRGY